MSKLWLVAKYEYKRQVFKISFLIAVLSLPLMLAVGIGLIVIINAMENKDAPVGYVDHAGFLTDPIPAPRRGGSPDNPSVADLLPLIPFPTEQAAREALESGEIQACYIIAEDYLESNRVELLCIEQPGRNVTRQFWDFMQINRLRGLPPEIARRAVADCNLIVRWPDYGPGGGREFSERTFLNQFLPFIIAVGFMVLLFVSSGSLMGTMVEEKENRTMEILATSLSPGKLIGGKIVGVIAMSLTQFTAWSVFAGLAVIIAGWFFKIQMLQNLTLEPGVIIPMAAVAIPAYVMVAALMSAVGVMVSEAQEAQQTTFFFLLPFMITFWLIKPIIEDPNGPLALGLSFFPLTSFPAFSIRIAFSRVATWQIFGGVAILIVCALSAVWIAGRAFRLGMLRYGKRLNWGEIFGRGYHE